MQLDVSEVSNRSDVTRTSLLLPHVQQDVCSSFVQKSPSLHDLDSIGIAM